MKSNFCDWKEFWKAVYHTEILEDVVYTVLRAYHISDVPDKIKHLISFCAKHKDFPVEKTRMIFVDNLSFKTLSINSIIEMSSFLGPDAIPFFVLPDSENEFYIYCTALDDFACHTVKEYHSAEKANGKFDKLTRECVDKLDEAGYMNIKILEHGIEVGFIKIPSPLSTVNSGLIHVFVDPNRRREGIGTYLTKWIVGKYDIKTIYVPKGKEEMYELLKKMGYRDKLETTINGITYIPMTSENYLDFETEIETFENTNDPVSELSAKVTVKKKSNISNSEITAAKFIVDAYKSSYPTIRDLSIVNYDKSFVAEVFGFIIENFDPKEVYYTGNATDILHQGYFLEKFGFEKAFSVPYNEESEPSEPCKPVSWIVVYKKNRDGR